MFTLYISGAAYRNWTSDAKLFKLPLYLTELRRHLWYGSGSNRRHFGLQPNALPDWATVPNSQRKVTRPMLKRAAITLNPDENLKLVRATESNRTSRPQNDERSCGALWVLCRGIDPLSWVWKTQILASRRTEQSACFCLCWTCKQRSGYDGIWTRVFHLDRVMLSLVKLRTHGFSHGFLSLSTNSIYPFTIFFRYYFWTPWTTCMP